MEKMLQAEIWTVVQAGDGNAVLLRPQNQNVAVPIFIGQLEIQSILIGKESISLPRPLTHDLLLNLVDSLNLVLDRVEIHEIKDSTFHARLVITGGAYSARAPLILDSRPSDALGLAARRKCPILISEEIVSETGISLELFINALKHDSTTQEEKREKLIERLNKAVEMEEYEQAAKIRDLLKDMEQD